MSTDLTTRWSRFLDTLKSYLIIYRNYAIDLWLVTFNLPLYYRCANLWKVRGVCYRDATWGWLGKLPSDIPRGIDHRDEPLWCDHCATTDIGLADDMKRVGRWYRTAVWVHDLETRKRIHRPVTGPEIEQ